MFFWLPFGHGLAWATKASHTGSSPGRRPPEKPDNSLSPDQGIEYWGQSAYGGMINLYIKKNYHEVSPSQARIRNFISVHSYCLLSNKLVDRLEWDRTRPDPMEVKAKAGDGM